MTRKRMDGTVKERARSGHGADLRLYKLLQGDRFLIAKILRRFSFGPTEIEDVTQETILRAIEAERTREIRHPRQFMISVAKNIAREELRRRARATTELIEDCDAENHLSEEASADAALDAREKLRIFATAVAGLPPQCRRVFVMKHVQGAAHKEIADRLKISISTVEKHVAAGLKACRERMLARLNEPAGGDEVRHLFDETRKLKQR
ncbi:MAG: RNA polymerase sigma factor [Amphiplicatus sp.]